MWDKITCNMAFQYIGTNQEYIWPSWRTRTVLIRNRANERERILKAAKKKKKRQLIT